MNIPIPICNETKLILSIHCKDCEFRTSDLCRASRHLLVDICSFNSKILTDRNHLLFVLPPDAHNPTNMHFFEVSIFNLLRVLFVISYHHLVTVIKSYRYLPGKLVKT